MRIIKSFFLIYGLVVASNFSFSDNICQVPYPDTANKVINWLKSDISVKTIDCLNRNIDNIEYRYLLSLLYSRGIGVPEDFSYGLKLLIEAANKGQMLAAHDLGYMYEVGFKTVDQNTNLSIYWYKKAIELGYKLSIDNLTGILIRQGDYEDAYYWAVEGTKNGNSKSFNNLSVLYMNGLGVERNYIKGFEAAKKATELGSIGGAYIFSTLLVSDIDGIPYDEKQAYAVSIEICQNNFSLGCNLQAFLLYSGLGVTKDEMAAFNLLIELSDQQNGIAKINLADFYYYGLGLITKDLSLASKWYFTRLLKK